MKKISFVNQEKLILKSQEVKISNLQYSKLYRVFMKYASSIYSASHARDCKCSLKLFLRFVQQKNLISIDKLTTSIMLEFITSTEEYKMNYRQQHLSVIRIFLKFLYLNKFTKKDLYHIVPKLRAIKSGNIPHTIWAPKQVLDILNVIDTVTPTGKRNYAMFALMAYLGLRLVDVKFLKFENIDWKSNQIKLVQHKTNKYIVLPLLNNVGEYIIDYIKNGRPNYDSKYIFLNHRPVREFTKSNNLYTTFTKYLSLAQIDISNKTLIGVHSLRHSLASSLLQNGANLSTIASVLGHVNFENTNVYLKVDVKHLRKCCIELEVA